VFSLLWEISPKNEKKILGGTGPAQPFFLIGEISPKREFDNLKMN
jgi:hypothetical protein